MNHNVGSTERYARLAAGALAGAGAVRGTGWQRVALGAVAAAGIGTALSRYCPINAAVGRGSSDAGEAPLDQGRHDTELRRDSAMRSALGTAPTTGTSQRRVTEDSDLVGRAERP